MQAQHHIQKYRAVHVGIGKAIGRGVQFGVVFFANQPQRIKVCRQMATDAVGADDHQGADAIEHGAFDLIVRYFDTLRVGLFDDLFGGFGGLNVSRPLPVQRMGQIIVWHGGPVITCPTWTCGLGFGIGVTVAQFLEKGLPCFINRIGITCILGIKLLDIFGVMPLQEGGVVEFVGGGVFGHDGTSLGLGPYLLGPGWEETSIIPITEDATQRLTSRAIK